jgi:hypothetical protein
MLAMSKGRSNKYSKVGSPTDRVTDKGRRIYETPNREKVSEKSITIEVKDRYLNFPSIHDGVRYDQADIEKMYAEGKIKPSSVHDSEEDAIKAAIARSRNMKHIKKPYAYGGRVAKVSAEKS